MSTSAKCQTLLLDSQRRLRGIDDFFLKFAKKASLFNSWVENVEEDLTDPVQCNYVQEIKVCYFS